MNNFKMTKIVREYDETYYFVKFEKLPFSIWFSRWNAENWGEKYIDDEFKFYEGLRYIDIDKIINKITQENFTDYKIIQLKYKYVDVIDLEIHYMSMWEHITLIKGLEIAKEYKNVTIQDDEYTFFFEAYSANCEIKTEKRLNEIVDFVQNFNDYHFNGEFEIYIGDSILEGIYYK